jgi:hypothetical protein
MVNFYFIIPFSFSSLGPPGVLIEQDWDSRHLDMRLDPEGISEKAREIAKKVPAVLFVKHTPTSLGRTTSHRRLTSPTVKSGRKVYD